MKYLGGKTFIREWIRDVILSRISDPLQLRYIEPFVGSAAVWTIMACLFKEAVGFDGHKDLVLFLNAVRSGWKPPADITFKEYEKLRSAPPSPLRGYVGFMCSFGGKFFHGFYKNAWCTDEDERMIQNLRTIDRLERDLSLCPPLKCLDFSDVKAGKGDVVYCDPPYVNTEKYSLPFDTYLFWKKAKDWVRNGALVFVSEAVAPDDWCIAAERTRKAILSFDKDMRRNPVTRVERIYVHESQADSALLLRHQKWLMKRKDLPWAPIG
jgi:DNA adenine methylase